MTITWWEPKLGKEEAVAAAEAINSSFPNEGKVSDVFASRIASLTGSRYCAVTTSGTAAMFLSLKALGIGPGDEVIVPDMTFIATANAVEMTGAVPVLADVLPDSLCIDPSDTEKMINIRTKAVMPVHVSGRPADLVALSNICLKHGISMVEDAAEALTSALEGRKLGTYGRTGCFSFSPNKTITTGQGGAVVTDDEALFKRIKELKDQGRPERGTGGNDIHPSVGYNFKFTDIQAAVGLAQLGKLEERVSRIIRTYTIYRQELSGVKAIKLLEFDIEKGAVPQWSDAIAEDRDGLADFLASRGIGTRKFWYPIHTQAPYLRNDADFPVSSLLAKKAIWLPSSFTMSDEDAAYAAGSIKEYYAKRRN